MSMKKLSWFLVLLVQLANGANAADFSLKVVDKEPPGGVDAAIRSQLQPKAVQLLEGGKPVFEFWLRAEIPVQSKPASAAKSLDTVRQATLIGAVSVASSQRDYRDDELAVGVYTMRFVLQPQDGNHLGTSEFSYFAALTPANVDTKLDGITDYKALVKASSKETATDHPVILSLRPASSDEGELPRLNDPVPDHKSVRIKVPAKAGDSEKTSVVFEVVYKGKGKK
jgi:hypothetical protein